MDNISVRRANKKAKLSAIGIGSILSLFFVFYDIALVNGMNISIEDPWGSVYSPTLTSIFMSEMVLLAIVVSIFYAGNWVDAYVHSTIANYLNIPWPVWSTALKVIVSLLASIRRDGIDIDNLLASLNMGFFDFVVNAYVDTVVKGVPQKK